MSLTLDTFLTEVSVTIATLLDEDPVPPHPGRPPRMQDAEVLTVLVLAQWRGSSERACLRWIQATIPEAFPTLLSQSALNRRGRRLAPRCAAVMVRLAEQLDLSRTPQQILDCTAVPLARQCRGERHRLFAEEAGIGRGGSDRRWYYGVRLLLALTQRGAITGLMVGPAPTQDRWLADALLVWRVDPRGVPWTVEDLPKAFRNGEPKVGPTGPRWWPEGVGRHWVGRYLVDDGFIGQAWQDHWEHDTMAVVTGAPAEPGSDRRTHHAQRQVIETVNALLHGTYALDFPLAKTIWGVVTRIVAKCTACNLATYLNDRYDRPWLAHQTLVAI